MMKCNKQCNIFTHVKYNFLSRFVWSLNPIMPNVTKVMDAREVMGQAGLGW